jgi:prevent-host-death family protein
MKASEAKNKFGLLMDMVTKEPVVIEKHGREHAILLSKSMYDRLFAVLHWEESLKNIQPYLFPGEAKESK